ncbi:group I truncated hemoglobin [Catellatospora methionotrophica]|uniref:group I truncated hemoglobin n=1 Tax=Catellatospora methionotrophica TaxID=121620 RepID=UPI0033EBCB0D
MSDSPGATTTVSSAYDLIGGAPSVREAVDRLYTYLLADEQLADYFDGIDLPRLKGHMVMLLTHVLGGPTGYPVENLGPAHARLNISVAHYERVAQYAAGVLFELHAPMDVILQVGQVLASVQPLIVAAPAAA